MFTNFSPEKRFECVTTSFNVTHVVISTQLEGKHFRVSPLKNAEEFVAFHAVNARSPSPIVRQFRSTLVRECCINIDKSFLGFGIV